MPLAGRHCCRSTLIYGLIGAILLWAALPPLDWWPLAWVAPVPWVLLIRRKELPGRRPYAVLTLAGFCFWMAALHWLRLPHPATSIGWVALSFYFAFYLPIFVGLSRVAVHRLRVPVIFAAPMVWTGLELARAHLLTGMTMGSLGHTQFRWIHLIQLSDLTGAYGVSFLVMFVAASLARMLPYDRARQNSVAAPSELALMQNVPPLQWGGIRRVILTFWPLVPAGAVSAAALIYGHIRIEAESPQPGPRIALVQGSVDIEMRYDPSMRERIWREYFGLSQEAVKEHRPVDLVVWPETMFLTGPQFHDSLLSYEPDARRPPEFDGTDAEFRQWLPGARAGSMSRMAQTARTLDVPLLVGVTEMIFGPKGVQYFNAAAYVARDGRLLGCYDKMHLVMFGEYVPFARQFPWLQRLTPLPISVTPGQRPASFELRWGGSCTAAPKLASKGRQYNCRPNRACRIAPNICYESVLPHVIRRQVNALAAAGQQPDILINLTNDGWFWGSSELDMHLVCGVFRAVECRMPFLIAANTGFSAWIDGNGCIKKQGPRRAKDVIIAEPRLDQRHSWYLAHGDWFAGVCLAACGLCGLVGMCGRARKKPLGPGGCI